MAEKYTDTGTRKDQIVEAIVRIMAARGTAGLTVRAIADELGIVPSAVYRHFTGKDAMIDATLDYVRLRMAANIRAAKETGMTPLDSLHTMFETHVEFLFNTLGAGNVFITTEIALHFPEKRKSIMSNMKMFHDAISALISGGQKDGSISFKFTPEELAGIYTGLFMTPVMIQNISGGKKNLTDIIKSSWATFEKIVKP